MLCVADWDGDSYLTNVLSCRLGLRQLPEQMLCVADWDGDSYLNKSDLEVTLLKLTQDGLNADEVNFVVDKVNTCCSRF